MKIKIKYNTSKYLKIALTQRQLTHVNVVKFIFDLSWRVPLERQSTTTIRGGLGMKKSSAM